MLLLLLFSINAQWVNNNIQDPSTAAVFVFIVFLCFRVDFPFKMMNSQMKMMKCF